MDYPKRIIKYDKAYWEDNEYIFELKDEVVDRIDGDELVKQFMENGKEKGWFEYQEI